MSGRNDPHRDRSFAVVSFGAPPWVAKAPCPWAEQALAPIRDSGPPGAGPAPLGGLRAAPDAVPLPPTSGGVIKGQMDVHLPGSRRAYLGPVSWALPHRWAAGWVRVGSSVWPLVG